MPEVVESARPSLQRQNTGPRSTSAQNSPASVRKVTQQPVRKHSIDDTPFDSREDLDVRPNLILESPNQRLKSLYWERKLQRHI